MTATVATRTVTAPETKSNLMAASQQWATRPADERYWNLADLYASLMVRNDSSAEKEFDSKELKIVPNGKEVCIVGPAGIPAKLSHWSFGQMCNKFDANAEYLRKKSPELAALNLNDDMKRSGDSKVQMLMHKDKTNANAIATVRAMTTDYARLWNGQIVHALMKNGLQNGWMTPPARPVPGLNDPRARKATAADIVPGQENFGLAVKEGDEIAPAGIYEGDRDMFLFLVNPTRIVDDKGGGLMRGVFLWNSEVGAGAFSVKTFLLENVCGNHICWGASKVANFRMVHRGDNIKQFAPKILKSLEAARPTDLRAEEKMIANAKIRILGKDKEDVVNTLYGRKALGITRTAAENAFDFAERWEKTAGAAPTTAWGFVHGLTRWSQTMKFADERDRFDEIGGKILEWVTSGKAEATNAA